MPASSKRKRRQRGSIEPLPSGAVRVRVYAGIDPLKKARLYLDEVVPPGPRQAREAEQARTRLLAQVDEKRNPRTRATVDQLLTKYMSVTRLEPTTRGTYEGYIKNHVRPLLGSISLTKLETETIDAFYAELATCRKHCRGKGGTDHRTDHEHVCDGRCGPHRCKPLAPATIRQIDAILSGACQRAVAWKWISVSPLDAAKPPAAPNPDPDPPTTEQAARISVEAWKDLDWGMFVWLAMMTGARRGELCALTWNKLDFAAGILTVDRSIAQDGGKTWSKDTKSHQKRRIALDQTTVQLLRLFRTRLDEQATALGIKLADTSYLFSREPDGSTWPIPDSVSQRYERMCSRLGYDFSLKELRHYSATELLAAGVDLRTVAGRFGHGGGGVTTLRVYNAFRPEADARAATHLGTLLPTPPGVRVSNEVAAVAEMASVDERSAPYRRIAADLRGAIACGALAEGDLLPTLKVLASRYNVGVGTAQRAIALLASDGYAVVRTGHRSVVAIPGVSEGRAG